MRTTRLEAFSDGVLAIVITVMVLLAMACFVAVAVLWLAPDKRMEKVILERGSRE